MTLEREDTEEEAACKARRACAEHLQDLRDHGEGPPDVRLKSWGPRYLPVSAEARYTSFGHSCAELGEPS